MCGILAIVDQAGDRFGARWPHARAHADRARVLLDRLQHRGPDAAGSLTLPNAWLGHRRLAVIDPQGSPQPFADGPVACTANGEIYNHAALRAELGRADLPGSDCAVIGPAWRAMGDALPDALDGQFAFVCADRDTGAWIAARDHMGICPLYAGWHRDGTIWFASEMKALIDDCRRVELVEPGEMWTGGTGPTRRTTWYTRPWMNAAPDRPADTDRLRTTLVRAVEKRLMADVPWGVLLSGGVDSSLIASISQRLALERGLGPIHTFSIGLEGGPDLAPARAVAEFLGTRHHEYTFTIDQAMHALPAVLHHLESDQQVRTGVPTSLLAQRIRADGFKMVLSGEGADELFGGYLYFHSAPNPAEFHAETVRKTTRLHQYDVMRANKAPMAFGLEVRVPFLDRAVIDEALGTDPAERMIDPARDGAPIEKAMLRRAFHDPADPWLPDGILWRRKEQFSDGVGDGWVDALRDESGRRVPEALLADAPRRFPEQTPTNREMIWMRELFERQFVTGRAAGRSPLGTLGSGRSVACSTPEAIAWNPAWASIAGDISGRGILPEASRTTSASPSRERGFEACNQPA